MPAHPQLEVAATRASLTSCALTASLRLPQDAVVSVVVRMREKFQQGFLKTADGMARSWSASVDIGKVAKEAKQKAARVLALLSVSQLEAAEEEEEEEKGLHLTADGEALVGPAAAGEVLPRPLFPTGDLGYRGLRRAVALGYRFEADPATRPK